MSSPVYKRYALRKDIKKAVLCLLVFILASGAAPEPVFSDISHAGMPKGEWEEHRSAHFILYYHPDIPDKYIREFTGKCERYYRLITDRLGFNRFDFWLWENRAKVFVYKTKEEYIKNTGRAEWSGASVRIKKKFISTFYFEGDFFDVILPHELGHIVLREFIGLKTEAPLWFDEGVACANEKDSLLRYFLITKGLVEQGLYLKVPNLEKIAAGEIVVPNIFYPTAASLVMFLLEEYGKKRFVGFCKEMRDGKTFYGAMDKAYGIEDAEELNERFIVYMTNKSYEDIVERENFNVKW
ncbi:MAG: hypothetical protein DRP85_06120 [Candidatus Makaraimicrobium thalassicum]|nr:MAG: hypothetical protein DRP85_06120 [Candidatus Omnitrophota bacterium]